MAAAGTPAAQIRTLQPPAQNQYNQNFANNQSGQNNQKQRRRRGNQRGNVRRRRASGDPYTLDYKCEADPRNRMNAMFSLSVQVERVDQNVVRSALRLQLDINRAGVQQFGSRASSFGGADESLLDKIFGDVDLAKLRLRDGGRESIAGCFI